MSGEARLSAQDASFLDRAAEGAPMNVAGVIRLGRTPGGLDLARMRAHVERRVARAPMLRALVTPGPDGPEWAPDPGFAIERHVDVLPQTGDDPALLEAIARLHASALPPDRPLWRFDLFPQGATGGAVLLFRANHALADGMSSMQVMRAMFDHPHAGRAAEATGRAGARPGERDLDAADDAYRVARDIWDSLSPDRRARLAADDYERALVLLDGWISILERGRPGGTLLPAAGPVRARLALTEAPSSALRALRRRTGARFDVVGLTVVAAAVSRLLAARGALPGQGRDQRIRTLAPVATSFGAGGDRLGNHASFLLLALPVGEMAPDARLALVGREVDDALRAGQHRAVAMSMRALETAPAELTERVNDFTAGGQFVDLVVSCVPGPRRALVFDGIPHELTHAVLPITEHVRLAVGWSDIAGRSGVAITADAAAVPELEFLTDALARSCAALLDACGPSP